MPALWQKLANLHPPTDDERQMAVALLDDYRARGYLRRTCRAMLVIPDGVMIAFYAALELDGAARWTPPADSGWMADADFCFINVRATGLGSTPGNFIQAAKLLPALRASAIHLGPFTDYDFHVIYAVRSVQTISDRVVHPTLKLSPEDQLRALVSAAHLLGKAVGFDSEPHMAQFARTVILRPELFRWLKLSPDRTGLAWGLSNEAMLEEVHQQRITNEIHALVAQTLRDEGLDDLETVETDSRESRAHKRAVYYALIGALIERGYWTIPAQSWAADGVPAFAGYNHAGNHPLFDYRGRGGEDLGQTAFHILTPFKFYTGMRPNQPPIAPQVYAPAVEYFASSFTRWRDQFGFDFVRYDSADHIFDSLDDDSQPLSDRPTPQVLGTCIERRQTPDRPYIGSLAERMGNEIAPYAALGFDLILGDDMLQQAADARFIEKCFRLYDELVALNAARGTRCAITFAVDTHDTGNPAFWGRPLVQVAGADGMRARHFLSRFSSAGLGRRPKYEAMGSQDLSYGLYEANVTETNLIWIGDDAYNAGYHFLEDVYERHRLLLAGGSIVRRQITGEAAWWLIAGEAGWLLAAVAFQTGSAPFSLDLSGLLPENAPVIEYDFAACNERAGRLHGAVISAPPLPPQGVWLLAVEVVGE
ncbi:MAG: hypothetical protein HZC41_09610 [Chloroflexi bacterium]|nr:hypothetical protein [Chloroflexota bacterium]